MGEVVMEDQVDQDCRKKVVGEDSAIMTIEFLRARLISERSVSRTAKQRADDLAKRVMELEEQLKNVNRQRNQDDEATSEDLVSLGSDEVSDCSGSFDLSPVREKEESSMPSRTQSEAEVVSDSELEASPLTGRSLSWRGCSGNPNAVEKKKADIAKAKQRSSVFTSLPSTKPRVGKSCRQIKKMETRSTEDKEGDSPSKVARARDTSSGLEHSPKDPKAGFGNEEERKLVEGHHANVHRKDTDMKGNIEIETKLIGWYETEECAKTWADLHVNENENEKDADTKSTVEKQTQLIGWYGTEENAQTCADLRANEHKRDTNTRRAIENETRLIGWYETEGNAQGEWEEKFRETGSCTPDSCARGDQSDVTEEREESREAVKPSCAIPSQGQEAKSDTKLACFSGVSKSRAPLGASSLSTCSSELWSRDQQLKNTAIGKENPGYAENRKQMKEWLGSSSYGFTERQSSVKKGPQVKESPRRLEASTQPGTSNDLEGVLEALQQAKRSLKQELVGLSQTRSAVRMSGAPHPSVKPRHSIDAPIGCASLFRVPADLQLEAFASTPPSLLGPSSRSRLSFTSCYSESGLPSYNGFMASPYMEIGKPYADNFVDMGIPPPTSSRYTYPYTSPKIPSRNVVPRRNPSLGA